MNQYGFEDEKYSNVPERNHLKIALYTIFIVCLLGAWVLVILQITGVTDLPFRDPGWFGPP